jgi:TorA maturation chaperone TorD
MQQEETRSKAYRLFSRLFREGLTRETVALVRALPWPVDPVPEPPDFDELAAAHYDLFGFNVFPVASAFLEPEGRPVGRITGESLRWRQRLGLGEHPGEAPDHVSSLLETLGRLCADLSDVSEPGEKKMLERQAASFLDVFVLSWLPSLVCAIKRHGDAFYAHLAELTLELTLSHRLDLMDVAAVPRPEMSTSEPLDLQEASLADAAHFLLDTSRCGLWLSRRDIQQIGRGQRIPSGFGSRRQLLNNLFRSAAEYGRACAVLENIDAVAEGTKTCLMDISGACEDLSALFAEKLGQIDETRQLLDRMREGLVNLANGV